MRGRAWRAVAAPLLAALRPDGVRSPTPSRRASPRRAKATPLSSTWSELAGDPRVRRDRRPVAHRLALAHLRRRPTSRTSCSRATPDHAAASIARSSPRRPPLAVRHAGRISARRSTACARGCRTAAARSRSADVHASACALRRARAAPSFFYASRLARHASPRIVASAAPSPLLERDDDQARTDRGRASRGADSILNERLKTQPVAHICLAVGHLRHTGPRRSSSAPAIDPPSPTACRGQHCRPRRRRSCTGCKRLPNHYITASARTRASMHWFHDVRGFPRTSASPSSATTIERHPRRDARVARRGRLLRTGRVARRRRRASTDGTRRLAARGLS